MKVAKGAFDVLTRKYYNACVSYFKNQNDATYSAVVKAEHECRNAKISQGEICRVRYNAFNFVENENGAVAASN